MSLDMNPCGLFCDLQMKFSRMSVSGKQVLFPYLVKTERRCFALQIYLKRICEKRSLC